MTEIFNLSTIEKKSYRSFSHKQFLKRQNERKDQYSLAHFLKFQKLKSPKKAHFSKVFS